MCKKSKEPAATNETTEQISAAATAVTIPKTPVSQVIHTNGISDIVKKLSVNIIQIPASISIAHLVTTFLG